MGQAGRGPPPRAPRAGGDSCRNVHSASHCRAVPGASELRPGSTLQQRTAQGRARLTLDLDPSNRAPRLLQVGGGLSSRRGPWLPAGPRPPARARWGGPACQPSPGTHSWGLWWHWPERRCDPSPPGRRGAGQQAGGGQGAETILPEAQGPPRDSARASHQLHAGPRPTRPPRPPAHPDAVVPALPLGLQGPHACSVTHGPPAQTVAPLDFVGDDPDLVQGPHGHAAHVVGHVLPAGALRVAGHDPLAVPQVLWGRKGATRREARAAGTRFRACRAGWAATVPRPHACRASPTQGSSVEAALPSPRSVPPEPPGRPRARLASPSSFYA